MTKQRDWLGFFLLAALFACLMLIAVGASLSKADAAETCMKAEDFAADVVRHGGTSTLISAANYPKAKRLLDVTPDHEPIAADSAAFDEMGDGSSGLTFVDKGCVTAIWPTPSFMSTSRLKALLLGDPPPPDLPHV